MCTLLYIVRYYYFCALQVFYVAHTEKAIYLRSKREHMCHESALNHGCDAKARAFSKSKAKVEAQARFFEVTNPEVSKCLRADYMHPCLLLTGNTCGLSRCHNKNWYLASTWPTWSDGCCGWAGSWECCWFLVEVIIIIRFTGRCISALITSCGRCELSSWKTCTW